MDVPATDPEVMVASFFGEYNALKPLNASSIALAASLSVKSGAGYLCGFTVYNSKSSAQFIQVFDARSLPANGSIPATVFTVAQTANLPVQWIPWRTFQNGCFLVNSSTAATLTIGSADCFFDAQYI